MAICPTMFCIHSVLRPDGRVVRCYDTEEERRISYAGRSLRSVTTL